MMITKFAASKKRAAMWLALLGDDATVQYLPFRGVWAITYTVAA